MTNPAPYHGPPPTRLVTNQTEKPAQLAIALLLTVFTFGYFLPWAVAAGRGKVNAGLIGLLTLLTGWTIIGWIAALVLACLPHQTTAVVAYPPHQGWRR